MYIIYFYFLSVVWCSKAVTWIIFDFMRSLSYFFSGSALCFWIRWFSRIISAKGPLVRANLILSNQREGILSIWPTFIFFMSIRSYFWGVQINFRLAQSMLFLNIFKFSVTFLVIFKVVTWLVEFKLWQIVCLMKINLKSNKVDISE